VNASKLSRDHFAFLRGRAQGLPPKELWNRYLERLGPYDERRCRKFQRELAHQLAAIARRSGNPEWAPLLQRNKELIADGLRSTSDSARNSAAYPEPAASARAPKAAPTLEEFAGQFDLDMYSEAELVELYQEAYPPAKSAPTAAEAPAQQRVRPDAAKRRARLLQRQLSILDQLERLVCERPQPADATLAWLDPRVCARLARMAIQTLGELHGFICRHGANWHKRIERVGHRGAEVIVAWLQGQQDTLGALPSTALLPAVQARAAIAAAAPRGVTGLVPLERLALPASLATAAPDTPGSNRAPVQQCNIAAADDVQAIHAWLALRPATSHTWRAYRREAERFLLWSVFEAGKPMSALTSVDCADYRDFLKHPGSRWVGRRNVQRFSPDWRPFEGPLSASSIKTAMAILQSMCEWLARGHYLHTNPWDGVPASDSAPAMPSSRALSKHQWRWVQDWMGTLPQDARSARIRFLLGFGYRTGLRQAELAAAKVEWLRHEQLEDGSWGWSLMVLGKRKKWRAVALPASAVSILVDSFTVRGLSPALLDNPPDTPLLASLPVTPEDGESGRMLTPGRIYEIVKDAFGRCASWVQPQDQNAAARIQQASTHWLRHTYGSHAAQVAPLHVLKDQLGHASMTTTAGYAKADAAERQKAMAQVFG